MEPIVISTGQHREMLKPILKLFGIEPDIDLDLMRPNQTLADVTARAITALTKVFEENRPDAVVVQGDTTTAMSAAMAAFYQRIPVGHVEAGLRTDDLAAPFPEEFNRRVIGQVTNWHLAPTPRAKAMIKRDALDVLGGKIIVTGNTVIDALLQAVDSLDANPPQSEELVAAKEWKAKSAANKFVLITGHRRENFGKPFEEFCLGLQDIANAHPEALMIYPVHLNPNVQKPVKDMLSSTPNIKLAPVADYPVFVSLMREADLIITDSGGVQEEAPALGKPVLVTREVTERPEAVDAGGVRLVGPHRATIYEWAHRLLTDCDEYSRMAQARSPYGDGLAARRIIEALLGKEVEEFNPAMEVNTAG